MYITLSPFDSQLRPIDFFTVIMLKDALIEENRFFPSALLADDNLEKANCINHSINKFSFTKALMNKRFEFRKKSSLLEVLLIRH